MNLKDPKTANDVAKLAESLADRIEAAIVSRDTRAEHETAALLLGDGKLRVHASGEMIMDAKGIAQRLPGGFDMEPRRIGDHGAYQRHHRAASRRSPATAAPASCTA